MADAKQDWLTVKEAAEQAGCSEGWLRFLLGRGQIEGWKSGERAWNVSPDAVVELRKILTSRSIGKRDAKTPEPKRRKKR